MAEEIQYPTPDQMQVKSLYDEFLETGSLTGMPLQGVEEHDEDELDDQSVTDDSPLDGGSLDDEGHDVAGAIHKKRMAEAERERQNLARKETAAVNWLRALAVGVLLVAALTVCLGVYFYVCNDQKQDFEFVFESSATQVLKSFHASVARIAQGADAMSVAITSYALDAGAQWPMVTVPDFELRADTIRVMTKSINCAFIPVVHEKDRTEWERYVTNEIQNEGKLFRSFESDERFMFAQDNTFGLENIPFRAPEGNPLAVRNFSSTVTMLRPKEETGFDQPNNTGPYLAFYQTSPVLPLPALPNMNVFTFPPLAPPARNVLETAEPTLADNHIPLAMFNMFLARGQYRHARTEWVGDGATNFFYPVFDSFDTASRELVGMVLTNIYWRIHLQDILPDNARGIVAVIENNVNQTYTYRLDGPDVTFLGVGDLHDPAFDDMVMSTDLNEYLEETAGPETHSYTQLPLSKKGAVQYCLKVYPSKDMQEEYLNNDAIILALIVAAVFLFTSLVFLAYNTMVERRQKVVFDRAVKSAAVVSNLFPKEVGEELINNTEMGGSQKRPNKQANNSAWKTSANNNNAEPGAGGAAVGAGPGGDITSATTPRTTRLAKKHDNVTIMFADIAGFTNWSANREPEDVFELLETFYAAFDSLAVRRNVFKVESIGDVYMAVTGLPHPQRDHAMRMAKFARDCIQKASVLTAQLAPTLGNETLSLGLRVGLHSGSVTAGVLRGDKARFQLFGEAVNTAARMEARGLLGMVHISEATYKALEARGKGHVAKPRDEKLSTGGQGEEQTYFLAHKFVHPGSATAVMSTASTQKVGNGRSIATRSTSKSLTSRSTTSTTDHSNSESTGMDFSAMSNIVEAAGMVDFSNVSNIVDVDTYGQVDNTRRVVDHAAGADDDGMDRSVGSQRSAGSQRSMGSKGVRPHWQSMVAQVDSYRSLEGAEKPQKPGTVQDLISELI